MSAVHLINQGSENYILFMQGGEHMNRPVWLINWCEKWKALNMIPMGVGDNDEYFQFRLPDYGAAQISYTCSGIQYENFIISRYGYAGCISAITNGCWPRTGHRPAHPPKLNLYIIHSYSFGLDRVI